MARSVITVAPEQEHLLRQLYAQNVPIFDMGTQLDKPQHQIIIICKRLGLDLAARGLSAKGRRYRIGRK